MNYENLLTHIYIYDKSIQYHHNHKIEDDPRFIFYKCDVYDNHYVFHFKAESKYLSNLIQEHKQLKDERKRKEEERERKITEWLETIPHDQKMRYIYDNRMCKKEQRKYRSELKQQKLKDWVKSIDDL